MKRFLISLFAVLASAMAFGQSAKVVVDTNGEFVGKYIRTNATTYTVGIQDYFDVPKKGHKVVVYSAEAGQGYVAPKGDGNVNVRSTPSTSGKKIGSLSGPNGGIPEEAPCLGKTNGWYKIQYGNKIGYVRADLMGWDPMGF